MIKNIKIKRIDNAGLFSEPSLIIFTNSSDHDCTYTQHQVTLINAIPLFIFIILLLFLFLMH